MLRSLSLEPISENELNEIDREIFQLKYDSEKLLRLNRGKAENEPIKQGYEKKDSYLVVTKERCSTETRNTNLLITGNMYESIFPGAIIRVNRHLLENKPDLVCCKRKPFILSIDLPGMGNDSIKKIDNPTYLSITAAVQELLLKWNKEYSLQHKIVTDMQYKETMAYNNEQISTEFGCEFNQIGKSMGINYESILKGETSTYLLEFQQIFYNISIDAPFIPSELFEEEVTWIELTKAGINSENPPAYIENITYGRNIFISMTTSSKSKNIAAAFKFALSGGDFRANLEYKEIIENSVYTAVDIEKNSQEHTAVILKDIEKVQEFIRDNSKYSLENPGYPIFYRAVFLRDNELVSAHSKAGFIKISCEEYKRGTIVLEHSGAYIAQFEIKWTAVSYDKNGNLVEEEKYWPGNGIDISANFSTIIPIKGNACNLCIKVKERTGFAWEWWRTIADVKDIAILPKRKIELGGTTMHPKVRITPSL